MEDNYEPEYFYLYEIRMRQIIFDESSDVTIIGGVPDEDEYRESISWDFLCPFGLLTDILLLGEVDNPKCDLIIKLISEKLSTDFESPAEIDLLEIFGKEVFICNLVFKVYNPYQQDELGIWKPINDNCYFIDSIEDKNEFFKREGENYNFKVHFKENDEDLLNKALEILGIEKDSFEELSEEDIEKINRIKSDEQQLSDYFFILENAFKYYTQLLKKEFSEKEARKRAGLSDELLFRIASLKNKIKYKK